MKKTFTSLVLILLAISTYSYVSASSATVPPEACEEVEVPKNSKATIDQYRRSSICMILVEEDEMPLKETVIASFLEVPIPHKYNDHNINVRIFRPSDLKITKSDYDEFNKILFAEDVGGKDGVKKKKKGGGFGRFMKGVASVAVAVSSDKETTVMFDDTPKDYYEAAAYKYMRENNISKQMFDLWFLNQDNVFTMDLIRERGLYDATLLETQEAASSARGFSKLEDAGEELVGNTFVVVSRYRYLSKEELVKEINATTGAIGSLFGQTGSAIASLTSTGVEMSLGAGHYIRITSFLYQLDWNEEIANRLYSELWDNHDAYHACDMFNMKYIGSESAFANTKASIFTNKSFDELVKIATINATDAVLAKLEKKYDVFKTKTPILTTEPLTAAIGLREGLSAGDKFEVLELRANQETGKSEYRRVGVVSVSKDQIWDNRYMVAEELEATGALQEFTATKFDGEKGKYYSGMLLRQLK